LNPVASAVLVLFYTVTSVALVVILGLSLHFFNRLQAKLESLEGRIDPLLLKAEELLTVTNQKIVTIGNQTENILTHSEAVAEDVHDKVEKTASSVTKTVNAPIIGLNSAVAGLMRGVETFRLLQRKNSDRYTNRRVLQPTAVSSPLTEDPHFGSPMAAPRDSQGDYDSDISNRVVMQSGGRH
jgi:uncharacterized protein YoxC